MVSGFDYTELINLYRPVAKSIRTGTKKIKQITEPSFEERVVTNLFGKPKKDKNGDVIKEKIMVNPGGQIYYTEEQLYSSLARR